MFRKFKMRNEIRKCRKRIEAFEKKRARSQAALTEAILTQSQPNDADVDYFNLFTQLIEREREKMRGLKEELSKI